jgi:acetyl-CoA carboxylase carboxyltransferase component
MQGSLPDTAQVGGGGATSGVSQAAASDSSLTPVERLELLCDAGSLKPIRSAVTSTRLGDRARAGDGVVAGLGCVQGRPIACYAQDASFLGGSLGASHAETIDRLLQMAGRSRLPVVSVVESGGARMQEGTAALAGYARVFRRNVQLSGLVPQVSIIGGLAAGGGCYSPALTDFVVMTKEAKMFLTGPKVVREVTGEDIEMGALGGHRVHERNGVCDFVVGDDRGAMGLARDLLGYLPQHVAEKSPRTLATDPELSDPGAVVPCNPREVYDVRDATAAIVDAGSLLEVAPRWARSIMTAFARIDGRAVGIVANQPRYLGGVLDCESSQKGARFVERCNAFGVPLVVLVDTPGFMPGQRQESTGVIRFGATLLRAFAAATVPRLTVVIRKAFGGAFITMNSKDLGADLVLAWPQAEIGVMGATSATGIIHRRQLAAAADPESEHRMLAAAYAQAHLGADVAAAGGFVDEVIDPGETRARLVSALDAMECHRG